MASLTASTLARSFGTVRPENEVGRIVNESAGVRVHRRLDRFERLRRHRLTGLFAGRLYNRRLAAILANFNLSFVNGPPPAIRACRLFHAHVASGARIEVQVEHDLVIAIIAGHFRPLLPVGG